MNAENVKKGFIKVKRDVLMLAKDIDTLRQNLEKVNKVIYENKDKNTKISAIDTSKYDNFIKNSEEELSKINLISKELEEKLKYDSEKIEILLNEVQVLRKKQTEIEKDLTKEIKNNNLEKDFEKIDKKFDKIDSKFEKYDENIKALKDDFKQRIKKGGIDEVVLEEKLGEFADIINEKNEMERNAIRLEFTDEIAKIYDKFFSEILDLKNEMNRKIKDSKTSSKTKSESKKEEQKRRKPSEKIKKTQQKKEDGKLKKFTKWLFIDEVEEENEHEEIKKQVKKSK